MCYYLGWGTRWGWCICPDGKSEENICFLLVCLFFTVASACAHTHTHTNMYTDKERERHTHVQSHT